jgi:hypothetical protein
VNGPLATLAIARRYSAAECGSWVEASPAWAGSLTFGTPSSTNGCAQKGDAAGVDWTFVLDGVASVPHLHRWPPGKQDGRHAGGETSHEQAPPSTGLALDGGSVADGLV